MSFDVLFFIQPTIGEEEKNMKINTKSWICIGIKNTHFGFYCLNNSSHIECRSLFLAAVPAGVQSTRLVRHRFYRPSVTPSGKISVLFIIFSICWYLSCISYGSSFFQECLLSEVCLHFRSHSAARCNTFFCRTWSSYFLKCACSSSLMLHRSNRGNWLHAPSCCIGAP